MTTRLDSADIATAPSRPSFLSDERGATAIEYGMIASLLAIACIGGMTMLGAGNEGAWAAMVGKVVGVLAR